MSEKNDDEQHKVIERREVVISLPVVKVPRPFQGFIDFVREQGVVGLAVGLVLGTAAKSVVDSIVANFFNPVIGLVGGGGDLSLKDWCLRSADGVCTNSIGYGKILNDLLSFLIVAALVYLIVRRLKLDRLDKKKEA